LIIYLPELPSAGTILSVSEYKPDGSGSGGEVQIALGESSMTSWDVRGEDGRILPSGVYHVVVRYRSSEGEDVTLSQNITVVGNDPSDALAFSCSPNPARIPGEMQFVVSVSGQAPPSPTRIRIYSISSELVRVLAVENGRANWDLMTPSGRPVASGVYIAVLEATNSNGEILKGMLKTMVIR